MTASALKHSELRHSAVPHRSRHWNWKSAVRSALPQWVNNWREARYYLRHGEVELRLLDLLCPRDKESIDVGAHDGCYVHFLRKWSRRVYAFEPIPWLATSLEVKFPSKVVVERVALSKSEGTAVLHMPKIDGQVIEGCSTLSDTAASVYPGSEDIVVPVRVLDAIYSGDVGFMKIDVEGYEQDVLEGAQRTIDRCRPNMIVEIVERLSPGGIQRTTQFLRRRGYEGFFIDGGNLLAASGFDVATMQNEESYPDLTGTLASRDASSRFLYNFIFLPTERSVSVTESIKSRIANW